MDSIIFLTLNLVMIAFLVCSFIFRFEYDFVLIIFSGIFALFIALNSFGLGFSEQCEFVMTDSMELYVYGNNYTGYNWDYGSAPPQVTDVNVFHKNITNTYDRVCTDVDNVSTGSSIFLLLIYGIYALAMGILSTIRILEAMER